MRNPLRALIPLATLTFVLAAAGQTLAGPALTHALQSGGYVIVMRHASSPPTPPTKEDAEPDNPNDERQLDTAGKATVEAMGTALRRLHIPVGEVRSSPTYRARETARLAGLGPPKTYPELGDHGVSMSLTTDTQAEWLRSQATQFTPGKNTILITHLPNLAAAFPQDAQGMKDGDALVFGPDGKGGAKLVARIHIEEWPKLQP